MSKLDDLIKEKCPNGVKYECVGSIADVGTGSSNGNEAIDNGEYPFFVRSQTVKAKNDYEYDEEAIIIPGEGGIGDIYHYVNGKYALHQRVYRIHFKDDRINTRFMYYCFSAFFKRFILKKAVSATVTSIRKPMIEKFEVPIPPLEVQNEIVQILDNFAELTAELTAELSNRKKQYEYYRDLLLDFDENEQRERGVRWVSIEDICEISRGFVMSKDFIRDNAGEYPVYSSQTENNGMLGCINTYKYDGDYLTWTTDGANAGTVFRRSGKFSVTNVCGLLKVKDSTVSNDYLYYILSNTAKNYVNSGMGNPKLMSNVMARIKVPIPDNKEQQRIVDVLDRFDKLTSDISEGLPAEIEAREKQYAYYRDKLLLFKELETEMKNA
ncbi:MAG: restriction endonuclease subunit S [Candidatus Saccharibacteria bacterium]|nr:restriction endonuclease subunit S [Candidatus Saccharibacteria bacterium]